MLHRTNDSFRATNPDDEFLGPEPEDEDEHAAPEPSVTEVWDGGRMGYVHVATFASGKRFYIQQARAGAFVGDWEIYGPDSFYADGYTSVDAAIEYITDIEHWGW